MIDDLINLRKQSRVMQSCTTHLICLLTRGVIQRELIYGYNSRQPGERAHEFLIKHVFYIVPSITMTAFADMYYKRFEKMTPDERRLEVSFTLENSKHSYALCPVGTLGPISRKLKITCKERVLYISDVVADASTDDSSVSDNEKKEELLALEDSDTDGPIMDYDLKPLPFDWSMEEDDHDEENEEEQKCGEELVDKIISSLHLRRADKSKDNLQVDVIASTSTEYKEIESAKEKQSLPSLPDVHSDWNSIMADDQPHSGDPGQF